MRGEGYEAGGVVDEGVVGGREAGDGEPGGEGREAVVVPVGVGGEGWGCDYGAEVGPRGYEFGGLLGRG